MVQRTKRRITPEEDYTRLAERIGNEYPHIVDRSTFDKAFNAYFQDETLSEAQNTVMRENVFRYLQKQKPGKISVQRRFGDDEAMYKVAGGKVDNLGIDRRKTAKVTKDKRKYIYIGAKKIDLAGLDTKVKKEYQYVGKIKRKIVYARRTVSKVRGREMIRFRDKRGRFVAVKK